MNNVWFLSRLRGKERTCQTRPNATLRVWPDAAHLAWSLVDFPLAWFRTLTPCARDVALVAIIGLSMLHPEREA